MFSDELLDKLLAEAQALGLSGATPITVALRNQLTQRKKHGAGVTDERHRTYWLAGRVVDEGISYPVPGVAEIQGMAAVGAMGFEVLKAHYGAAYGPETVLGITNAIEEQSGAARVGLTRKGEGHFSLVTDAIETSEKKTVTGWLDLWVFNDPEKAQAKADSLPSGQVA